MSLLTKCKLKPNKCASHGKGKLEQDVIRLNATA